MKSQKGQPAGRQGFTLIELLMYIGLTSILIAVMSQVFLATLGVRLESQATTSVQQDGRYSMARLAYDIRRAKEITAPTLGASQSGMTLVINEDGADRTYVYGLNGSDLILTVGSDVTGLNSDGSRVSGLSITRIGNTLGITLTLEDSSEVAIGGQTLELKSAVGLR